jgi:hypothetical protein
LAACSLLLLSGCDDKDPRQALGGGPGSSDIADTNGGFCDPAGGISALGDPSYTSGTAVAKIDTDGDPNFTGDATHSNNTSGKVNGQSVNSATYNYVVMSKSQMLQDNVSLGDWATVTGPNGNTVYARVEDIGPDGQDGEISEAAARAVGIQITSSSATVGDPTVVVDAYSQTSGIQGDCTDNVASL